MKRTPLKRSTKPMKRSAMPRGRKPMPRTSAKRSGQLAERGRVRDEVIGRDQGCCGDGIDGVPHDHAPNRANVARLEVHELRRGQNRSTDFLIADRCIALCKLAHSYATSEGYPEPCKSLGLVVGAWDDPADAKGRRLANGGYR